MDWSEWQEYYDLIEEEIQFPAKKGQKWILTLEERHTYQHDILFHVYSEQGEYKILVYEIVDVMELEMKERAHKLSETLSGNLRIHLSTLRAELPGEFDPVPDSNSRDGSRFKFSFANRKEVKTYEWELPKGDFKRIQPVLKLIWAVDQWRHGAKAMGWLSREPKEKKGKLAEKEKSSKDVWDSWSKDGKPFGEKGKKDWDSTEKDKSGRKGRIDPFGSIW